VNARELVLAFPQAKPETVAVDLSKPVSGSNKISLPPVGRVEVMVKDGEGNPFDGAAIVELGVAGDSQPFMAEMKKGKASFPYVGPGLKLWVQVRDPLDLLVTESKDVEGPKAAGEKVRAEVTYGVKRPIITGTLVDSSGEPLTARNLILSREVTITFSGGQIDMEQIRKLLAGPTRLAEGSCDAKGVFRFMLDQAPSSVTATRIRIGEEIPDGVGGTLARNLVVAKLAQPLKPGATDLGQLKLPSRTAVVTGIVHDADGKGIPGAGVRVEGKSRDKWELLGGLVAATDADGIFVISGRGRGRGLRLLVQKTGYYMDEPVEFSRGEARCKVELSKAGTLSGSVIMPDLVPTSALQGILEGDPACNHSRAYDAEKQCLSFTFKADGSFQIGSLKEGKAKLRIRLRGHEEDLVAFEEIAVEGAKVAQPENLQKIDLKSLINTSVVTVADEAGKPQVGAAVWVKAGEKAQWNRHTTDGKGRAVVYGHKDAFQLKVVKKGFTVESRADVKADVSVALKPVVTVPVTLRLAEKIQIPKAPLYIKARLVWVDPDAKDEERSGPNPMGSLTVSGRFDESRRLNLELFEPGPYDAIISVQRARSADRGAFERSIAPSEKNRVVLKADERMLDKTIDVEKGILDALINSM
jgi:hypothetical protein